MSTYTITIAITIDGAQARTGTRIDTDRPITKQIRSEINLEAAKIAGRLHANELTRPGLHPTYPIETHVDEGPPPPGDPLRDRIENLLDEWHRWIGLVMPVHPEFVRGYDAAVTEIKEQLTQALKPTPDPV